VLTLALCLTDGRGAQLFYLVATMGVFMVCVQGTIHLHHAIGFVAFYLLYVGVVILHDRLELQADPLRSPPPSPVRLLPLPVVLILGHEGAWRCCWLFQSKCVGFGSQP
jgi:hypothetical protein